jgi:streptogramin lyase
VDAVSRQTKTALAAVIGLLVGLGTLAGVVLVLRDAGSDGNPETAAADSGLVETGDTGSQPPVETIPVEETRTIEVGGFPNAVAVGEGAAWVVRDGRRVLRIDPATATVVARIGAGDDIGSDRPCDIAVGAGAVWVTTQSGAVARINPATNRVARLIPVEDAACVAVGSGGVWVTSPTRSVVTRLDPLTNETVSEIFVPSPSGITTGFGAVWVASPESSDGSGGSVSRIDRRTNEVVDEIAIPGVAAYVAAGGRRVWVTSDDGTVLGIDPQTDEVLEPAAQIATSGPTTLTVGGGSVWAAPIGALGGDADVTRIDPGSIEIEGEPIPIGDSPLGMDFGARALWVTNYETGTVTVYSPSGAPA